MKTLFAGGLIAGGSLTTTGAVLPWLTLDAGLQRYGGTTGIYGWLVVAAGAVAIAAGCLALRRTAPWLVSASGILGVALLAFGAWLIVGLDEFVRRPDALMLVPRTGPGLYVVVCGALLIVLGAGVARWRSEPAHDES
jgi:hypothetical protein